MKQIKETEKQTTIILEDEDILEICKMGSKQKTRIVCTSHVLHFDDITYKELLNMKEEKKAIKAMEKYLKKHDL